MRIYRHNYDKPHRCPGWSGPALKGSSDKERCPGGSFAAWMYDMPAWRWRFIRCRECDCLVLPHVTRDLDPTWWMDRIKTKITDYRLELQFRRDDREREKKQLYLEENE